MTAKQQIDLLVRTETSGKCLDHLLAEAEILAKRIAGKVTA